MILAVDPGINGALALYDGRELQLVDMPTYVKPAGKRQIDRRFIDEPQLVRIVMGWGLLADWLVMEQVGGIPGQSASSAFTFGRGVGIVIAAAIACGLKREEVASSQWKSALKVPADKRGARARASELLPAWSNLWPLQKHDGRAECALIGLYGWQTKGSLT